MTALLPYVLPLIVTVRLSPSDNAYFYIAWTLAGLLRSITPAVSLSLFAEGVHRPDEIGAMARSALRIIGAILLPGLVAIVAVGGTLLSALGPAYAHHGVGLLRITALASIPAAVYGVYGSMLRAQGRLTTVALLFLGDSVGTVVISWFLLPVLGISGVGWAFLATQGCGCVYAVLAWRKATSPKRLQSGPHQKEAQ
jgi:O-antigen/teichoic acid export membrane protein